MKQTAKKSGGLPNVGHLRFSGQGAGSFFLLLTKKGNQVILEVPSNLVFCVFMVLWQFRLRLQEGTSEKKWIEKIHSRIG